MLVEKLTRECCALCCVDVTCRSIILFFNFQNSLSEAKIKSREHGKNYAKVVDRFLAADLIEIIENLSGQELIEDTESPKDLADEWAKILLKFLIKELGLGDSLNDELKRVMKSTKAEIVSKKFMVGMQDWVEVRPNRRPG